MENSVEIGDSIAILSTASDLVRCLVTEVAGSEISDGVGGELLSPEMISEITLSIFHRSLLELTQDKEGKYAL